MGLFSDHRGGCGDTSCCFTAEAAIMGLFAVLLFGVSHGGLIYRFAARRPSWSHCLICCMWGCRGTF